MRNILSWKQVIGELLFIGMTGIFGWHLIFNTQWIFIYLEVKNFQLTVVSWHHNWVGEIGYSLFSHHELVYNDQSSWIANFLFFCQTDCYWLASCLCFWQWVQGWCEWSCHYIAAFKHYGFHSWFLRIWNFWRRACHSGVEWSKCLSILINTFDKRSRICSLFNHIIQIDWFLVLFCF